MKIFEVKEPYYAIICAEDEQECLDYYERVVADIEDREEFDGEISELETTIAITRVANTISEETKEPVGLHEAGDQVLKCLNGKEPCLLGLDGSLA